MPPIAPAPQASRAGLITSLVVFVVLFVTATIFAIYFGTQFKAAEMARVQTLARFTPSVNDADLNLPEVIQVNDYASKHAPMTGLSAAIQQRDSLSKIITGNPNAAFDPIKDEIATTLKGVRSQLEGAKVTAAVGEDNLLGTIKVLANHVVGLSRNLADSRGETKAAEAKLTQEINQRQAALADKDAKIAEAQKAADEAKAASEKRSTEVSTNVDAIKTSSDAAVAEANKQTATAQAELTKTIGQLKKMTDQYEKLVVVVGRYRLNPSQGLIRPAGLVTQVPGNSTIYINLGQGESISPGLTFEVYSKSKGLPSLTAAAADNNELPAGKASVEVIRVLPGTSECRIIRSDSKAPIVEGDLLLNIVYNTHTKFSFVVYGDFDLAGTGQPTPSDSEVMRRLVTQWGGRLQEGVNVDTDFVILGKEPIVNAVPEGASPLDQERHDKQVKALNDYLALRSEAIHLSIPILNQNRFLYFVGYYDQAKR